MSKPSRNDTPAHSSDDRNDQLADRRAVDYVNRIDLPSTKLAMTPLPW